MSKPDGGPAFPVQDMSKTQVPGMTLRDYFAGQALAVFLEAKLHNISTHESLDTVGEKAAVAAYIAADAMLQERDR